MRIISWRARSKHVLTSFCVCKIYIRYYGEVLGASLSEYLLEKSRVILQSDGERNFHVFYYLFAGLGEAERTALFLDDITSYHYIRGGVHGLTREAVIDIDMGHAKESFENLSLCMSDVGFAIGDRESIFEVLAAILHLGNVDYIEGAGSFAEVKPSEDCARVADLLNLDVKELTFVLQSYTTEVRGESLQKVRPCRSL